MSNLNRAAVVCLWLAVFMFPKLGAQTASLTNPVVDHADPFITRAAGNSILQATTGRNITLWANSRMEDLRNSPKIVWTPSTDDPLQKSLTQIWSPTLWQFGDRWWIYFTATTDGHNSGHGIFALKSRSNDPLGPYDFAGLVDTGMPSIDPSLLRVAGISYLMFVSVTGRNLVWIAPLSSPQSIARKANWLIVPDQPWEMNGGRDC